VNRDGPWGLFIVRGQLGRREEVGEPSTQAGGGEQGWWGQARLLHPPEPLLETAPPWLSQVCCEPGGSQGGSQDSSRDLIVCWTLRPTEGTHPPSQCRRLQPGH
jgi:hypothetical protein